MTENKQEVRWWNSPVDNMHSAVVAAFKKIDTDQEGRLNRYKRNISDYTDDWITSLDGDDWDNPANFGVAHYDGTTRENLDQDNIDGGPRERENILRSIIDTLISKIPTQQNYTWVIANDRGFELKEVAQAQQDLIEGVKWTTKALVTGIEVFRDACLFDVGLLKITPDYDRNSFRVERVVANEIAVDAIDGKYKKPRNIFQHKTVSRDELYAMFPQEKNQQAIAQAAGFRPLGKCAIDDPVSLIEAWHLPSGPNVDPCDGKWIICTSAGTLQLKEWKREQFPFAVWRSYERVFGWHGKALIDNLRSLSVEHGFLSDKIQSILELMTTAGWVPSEADVVTENINNNHRELNIHKYSGGTPPIFSTTPPPSAELFGERSYVKSVGFEQAGVNEMSAAAQIPQAMQGSSGIAIQTVKDTESERNLSMDIRWERFWDDVDERILDAGEDLLAFGNGPVTVNLPSGRTLKSITLSKKIMERDRLCIQRKPANMLPRDPAGRLSIITQMISNWPQFAPLGPAYLDYPDTDEFMRLASAPVVAIQYDISRLIKGEFITPEPFLNLELAKGLVLAEYNDVMASDAPQDVREAFIQYLTSVDKMIDAAKMAEMQAMQAAAGPPGMGGLGPVSPGPVGPDGAPMPLPPGPEGMPPGGTGGMQGGAM